MGTKIRIGALALASTIFIAAESFTIKPERLQENPAPVITDQKESVQTPSAKIHSGGQGVVYPQYFKLENELNRYYEIERNGGWQKIAAIWKKHLWKGQSDPIVRQLKARLHASGDFKSDDQSELFTEDLSAAVKRVQRQFGFKQDGIVNAGLVKELNVPVEKRIDQLLVNLERMKRMPAPTPGTRLVANIPEFQLHVFEGTRKVFDMAIVVGTEGNKTVVFNDEMKHIVFSPYWNVPPSIVREEILPAMRKNRGYLRRNGYEQTGTENGLPVIRQKPGPKNSLGLVKFVFPNSHNIYFHDTPAKSLFQFRKRAFSHGCIRLSEPAKLAKYLLRNSSNWTPEKIDRAMKTGKEQWVSLPETVPVAITYFTAWVDDDGLLNFREDIYGHDRAMAKKIARS
ncbi:MAG TPA: L,D-transpeptidase family protein [Flavisolibacter sp.]